MARLYLLSMLSIALVIVGIIWYALTGQQAVGLVAVLGAVIFLLGLYTYRLWGE